jgi:hypothetical protein
LQAVLGAKGIDHFEERELIEIGVAGANSPDAAFTHKNGRVRVVEQIAGEMRQLQNDTPPRRPRAVLSGQELRGLARQAAPQRNSTPPCAPRPSHDPSVCCHAQKVIEDGPSSVPSIRSRPLALEPVTAGGMKLRGRIGGVDQVHWCRRRALATFHGVVQRIAVGNIDECSAAAELW